MKRQPRRMSSTNGPVIDPDAPDQHPLIVQAFKERRRIGASYRDKPSVIEPQCHGIGKSGKQQLRVYLPEDTDEHKEKRFDVDALRDLQLRDDRFDKPGPHYQPNGSWFRVMFHQLIGIAVS